MTASSVAVYESTVQVKGASALMLVKPRGRNTAADLENAQLGMKTTLTFTHGSRHLLCVASLLSRKFASPEPASLPRSDQHAMNLCMLQCYFATFWWKPLYSESCTPCLEFRHALRLPATATGPPQTPSGPHSCSRKRQHYSKPHSTCHSGTCTLAFQAWQVRAPIRQHDIEPRARASLRCRHA